MNPIITINNQIFGNLIAENATKFDFLKIIFVLDH